MNRTCMGDLFSVPGSEHGRYYRCFGDGAVSAVTSDSMNCPSCRRPMNAADYGELLGVPMLCVELPDAGPVYVRPTTARPTRGGRR